MNIDEIEKIEVTYKDGTIEEYPARSIQKFRRRF